MRSHMTDRPFRCCSCYKCFSDESALRDHIPKHNETKHLKTKICPVCGKSYAQETYLARHMLRHQVTPANQVTPTNDASRAVHLRLPPISLPTCQSATVVPTPVYHAALGSHCPQLPSGVFYHSGTEPVGFRANFFSSQYISGDQLK